MISHDGPLGLIHSDWDLLPKELESQRERERKVEQKAKEDELSGAPPKKKRKRKSKTNNKRGPDLATIPEKEGILLYDHLGGKSTLFYLYRSIDLLLLINDLTVASFRKLKRNKEKQAHMGITVNGVRCSCVPYLQVCVILSGMLSHFIPISLVRGVVLKCCVGVCTDTHNSEQGYCNNYGAAGKVSGSLDDWTQNYGGQLDYSWLW
jgi:hypothetical protein